MNLAMLLEMAADGAPDRIALGDTNSELTNGELLARARRAAALFTEQDIAHVGFVDVNSEAMPIALFGAALAGIPFVPINYRLTDDQLARLVGRIAPALVLAGPGIEERLACTDATTVIARDLFLAMLESGHEEFDAPFVDPDEIAILLFTSGTTGEPKAAVLRHRHLTSYIIGSVEFMGADDSDAQLVSIPPYHIAGVSTVLSCVYSGRRLVYLPSFDPGDWVRVAQEQRVTQAMVVPTMLGRIIDELQQRDVALPTLRLLAYGGGPLPTATIAHALQLLPDVDFVNAYGLTETSSTIAVLTPEDHREAFASTDPAVRGRLESVGRPLPMIEIEVRGPDGAALPAGERGELFVRGEQVAGEYVGSSRLTADGWFPTRDAGYLDADGFLYLDGRLDDVIVRGGENIAPGEIEATLTSHPAVASAAVVGIPDVEWGEAVAAVVVLESGARASEEELQQWVRERLRSTKTPELIRFRAELPHNETGKLLRRVLRDELAAERT
jgi:acyl-CoA synthetase (AMP-forming)/AMP-acid ligase II